MIFDNRIYDHPPKAVSTSLGLEHEEVIEVRIIKILSSASTAMNLTLAFALAKRFGYEGVEILPHRFVTSEGVRALEEKWDIKATSVHLPWWTWRGAWYWLGWRSTARTFRQEWRGVGGNSITGYMTATLVALLTDLFIHKIQTLTWLLIMGPLGDGPLDNPGLKLARELDLPVVVHPGPILELVQPPLDGWPPDPQEREGWKKWIKGQLAIFKEIVEVRIENNDAPFHPDSNSGGGMDQALFCLHMLQKIAGHPNAKLVFDGEHLAKEIGFWGLMSLESKLLPILRKLPRGSVVEAHICGYDPGEGGVKKGGHLPLSAGSFPIRHNLLALIQTKASPEPFEVTVETPPGIGDFFKLLFLGERAGKAYAGLLAQHASNETELDRIAS